MARPRSARTWAAAVRPRLKASVLHPHPLPTDNRAPDPSADPNSDSDADADADPDRDPDLPSAQTPALTPQVNKGPKSAGVVAAARTRGFLAVRGNHDDSLLFALERREVTRALALTLTLPLP